jgi:SprT protein
MSHLSPDTHGQQLVLDLGYTCPSPEQHRSLPQLTEPAPTPAPESKIATEPDQDHSDLSSLPSGPAEDLRQTCIALLTELGMTAQAKLVSVNWNRRLTSTAGYAKFPSWVIDLNPRLTLHVGQVDRTLRHELAHLVAYQRAGRRKIDPHGNEWRRACAELGIPNEPAHHHLPFPRTERVRKLCYQCTSCKAVIHRARAFRNPTACLSCCRRFANGKYDSRFRLVLVQP